MDETVPNTDFSDKPPNQETPTTVDFSFNQRRAKKKHNEEARIYAAIIARYKGNSETDSNPRDVA